MLFDSHAHYDDRRYSDDRDTLLSSMPGEGVGTILCCATDLKSAVRCIALAEQYEFIYASAGIHPHLASRFDPADADRFKELLAHPKCIAVGEMGLDYHRDLSPRTTQRAAFSYQLALAKALDMPVIVHDRDAHADTLSILREYGCRGVMHCFSGSAEMAEQLIALGFYISFPGVITYPNARRSHEAIRAIPREFIMIETDAPYLPPVPHRGQRNDSRYLRYTCQTLADILDISYEEAAKLTADNARRCFGIATAM